MFTLLFTKTAKDQLENISNNNTYLKRYKAVCKALGYLQTNPKHPGLNTHKYHSIKGPNNEEVFEAYAENHTSQAYRIFWCYGPKTKDITILAITHHP